MSEQRMADSSAKDVVAARVIANFRSTVAVQPKGTAQFEKALPLNHLPLLVAGDQVICRRENQTLRVVELVPRTSVLERADRYSVKPLAANLTHLGIVSANPPGIDTLLIDQFCLAAFRSGVSALIIFNKKDKMSDEEVERVNDLSETYRAIGYEVAVSDTKTEHGMLDLQRAMSGCSMTLVGASGAGKSSIIKKLLPDREVRVGEVSKATGLGSHTTSVTYWYELPENGAIIDSPGVRQYSVAHLDETVVRQGFHELAERASECRFGNCTHSVEPACAVLDAVAKGAIAQWRYDNYRKLTSS